MANLQFVSRVRVFAGDNIIYDTHPEDAARLLREGLALRRDKGKRVRAVNLITIDIDCSQKRAARGNPQKYTFLEPLGDPVAAHCHSLKPHIADKRNWPIFRAALVDCLPASAQAEIRDLFAGKKRVAA